MSLNIKIYTRMEFYGVKLIWELRWDWKGDGNDGEPDALEKLEMEKKAKNWLELKNCGWLGSYLKNIQSDLPNETRGQS